MSHKIELLASTEDLLSKQINEHILKGYKLINKQYDYEDIRDEYLGVFGPRGFVRYRKGLDIWKATMEHEQ